MYKRNKYLDKTLNAIKKEKLVLLLGTRQVGKTTILELLKKELEGKIYYYSFENEFFKLEFSDKKDFINYFEVSLGANFYEDGYFLFDEFQYIKNGEKILKSLYDDKKIKLKFIITGSGLWTYSKDNKGTLVGRGEEIFVYPFDFFEFLDVKGVKVQNLNFNNLSENIISLIDKYYIEYLSYGGYPKVVLSKKQDDKIKEIEKIITKYIERDVSYFLKEQDLVEFKKFFLYLSSQIGNLIKKEAIANFLGIKTQKVEEFLYILEKTMFIYRVFPFFTDKTKELSNLPKIYFQDVGVINFLQKSFNFRENDGIIVENFVFNEVQKNKYFNADEIKTYKKINKSEIDFIYDGFNEFIPIEVKSGTKKAIPKIFYIFEKVYNKKTSKYILSSNKSYLLQKIDKKDVFIIPNWFIGKVL